MSQKASVGLDGPVTGAALAMTLYGLAAIFAGAVLGVEFVPHSTALAGLLMTVLLIAGAIVGAGVDRARARRN